MNVAQCPHLAGFDPLAREVIDDPYPSWDDARACAGVVYVPVLDRYVAVSYAAVRQVLANTEELSSADIPDVGEVPEDLRDRLPDGYPLQPQALINCDGARHTTIRKLTQQAFTVSRVNALEPMIAQLAADLAAKMAQQERVDLVAEFAAPMSTIVLARALGVPDAEADRFRTFSDIIIELTTLVIDPQRRRELTLAAADFNDYVKALIDERRAEPQDDVITGLLQATDPDGGQTLSELSVISIVSQLIVAGHETTATLLENAVWLLLEDRARWEEVRADRSLVEAAIEETLRRMAPIKHLQRTARTDVVIDGVRVPEGARILIGYGAANTDPQAFDDPLSFRLDRHGDKPHVAFGRGKHFCLGAPLARLEGRLGLQALLSALPNLRLDPDDPPTRARALSVYTFDRLPLLTGL